MPSHSLDMPHIHLPGPYRQFSWTMFVPLPEGLVRKAAYCLLWLNILLYKFICLLLTLSPSSSSPGPLLFVLYPPCDNFELDNSISL